MHQFLPLSPTYKSGDPIAYEYYLFNGCTIFDTAIIDGQLVVSCLGVVKVDGETKMVEFKSRKDAPSPFWHYRLHGYLDETPLQIDRDVVGSSQVWFDQRFPRKLFLGDEIIAAFEAADMQAPLMHAR